jgi:adenosylhomocysteine nucleosidase
MAMILILAALPEEADALFPDAGIREAGPFAVRLLEANGHRLTIATTGLGKVNAALAAGLLGSDADLLLRRTRRAAGCVLARRSDAA